MSDSPESPAGSDLNRRDLLEKAGQIGAGAVAAGSLAGAAKAAPKRRKAAPPRGGKVTWALEQDPAHIAPFGGILTANHWGKAPMYESLIEWDAKLNERPALATGWKVVDARTIDFTLRRGVKFHNGKEVTAADCKYSFDLQPNPPAAGQRRRAGPGAGDRGDRGAEQVRAADEAEEPGRAGVRLPRLEPLLGDRARGHVQPGQRRTRGDRHGAVPARSSTSPNSHVEFARYQNYWKKGLPYLDALSFKILADEQARVAALRAGAIDGGTFSADSAKALGAEPQPEGAAGPDGRVPRAADDDQAGRPQAVARQARPAGGQLRDQPPEDHQQGLQRVRRVQRARPAGLRPVAAHAARSCSDKYEKFDLPKAQGADEGRPGCERASRSR